jgi:hypothetical protein
MIGYVTLGTNDLSKAAKFYDKIASEMGIGRFMESDTFIAWGSPGGGAGLGLAKPFDGKAMSVGNGVMVALAEGQGTGRSHLQACAVARRHRRRSSRSARRRRILCRLFQGSRG